MAKGNEIAEMRQRRDVKAYTQNITISTEDFGRDFATKHGKLIGFDCADEKNSITRLSLLSKSECVPKVRNVTVEEINVQIMQTEIYFVEPVYQCMVKYLVR